MQSVMDMNILLVDLNRLSLTTVPVGFQRWHRFLRVFFKIVTLYSLGLLEFSGQSFRWDASSLAILNFQIF
jgi:hypothetical protein